MKQFFQQFFRHIGHGMTIALGFLLMSGIFVFAISYPATTPTGETTGGKFRTEIDALKTLVDTKQKRVAGSCTTVGQSITMINPDGTVSCGTGGGLGGGQTWQRPARALAAAGPTTDCFKYMGGANVYTNDTGKPIFVSISMSIGGNSGGAIFVDGLERGRFYVSANNANGQLTAIIPPGSTYSAQPSCWGGGLNQWSELR